jgi:class 3 adenylate cyclase
VVVIETVTVLFTDLVGSTELASALPTAVFDELRRTHFSVLRQAVAAFDGTEVKNLGDGLMVVFPAASAALGCAVAMQQAVERENAKAVWPLGLRIGVSAGEATKEVTDYFGDPVIEASRLCARAEAGQILVAGLVRANAGRRSPHTFSSVGELELKGLPEPVETLEVVWDPLPDESSAERIPLPTRLAHRPSVGVIGRDQELALLGDAVKRVVNGGGSETVFVAGEPGEGKSTLVSEIARRAHERGMTVLLGRCDEDVGASYRPFREALGHYVTHADELMLRAHVAEHGGQLAGMVPALRVRLGDLPPTPRSDLSGERYLLFAAAVGLIDTASEERPLVLILDDLHWADVPSLQLLRHLVVNRRSASLLVLGTYRDAELLPEQALHDTVAALRREQDVSFLALKGLDDAGVVAFMEAAAGHELDDQGVALARAVYEETDGNPFFVAEVLRHLSECGVIVQDATGRWTTGQSQAEITLPESVRQVVGARVARIGPTATKVLSTAAVIGRDFEFDVLADASGVEDDEVLRVLDRARIAALVREVSGPVGRWGFSHALIQHTIYDDLGPTRRARGHQQVAEALERAGTGDGRERSGELARHYVLAASPTCVEKAIPYARQAGDAALAALAPEDAQRYFSQALDLLARQTSDDAALRIDLLTGLGAAELQSGRPEFRATLLDAAHEAIRIHDSDRLVSAALANNRGFHSDLGGIDADKVEVLEAALAAIPDSDSPQRAQLLATLCSELTFSSLDRRVQLARDAKAMARRLGDRAALASVCNLCGTPMRIPSLLTEQFSDAIEALALAEELNDPVSVFWVANQAVIEGTRSGEFELSARALESMKAVAEKLRQPMLTWTALFSEAAQAMLHGDAARSEELATKAFEVGSASGQPDAFANYATQLMGIRLLEGRTGELVDLVAGVAEQHPDVPTFQSVLAGCYVDAGDERAALALLRRASDEGFALPMDTTWLDGVVVYARVTLELGWAEAAHQLLRQLEPHFEQVPYQGLTANPPVATFLGGLCGLVGRYREAEAYFRKGAALSRRGGMEFAAAYSSLLWARMLLRQGSAGDRGRAEEKLAQARSSAASRGYALLERRAAAAMAPLA